MIRRRHRDHHVGRTWWAPMEDFRLWRERRRERKAASRAAGSARAQQAAMAPPGEPEGILRAARIAALAAITVVITASSSASFSESYRGLWEWALHHWLSGFWAAAFPLQVDAFIVVGELVLLIAMIDRWTWQQRAGAWAVALLGLAVSVAGNIGHVAGHDLQSRGTAAIPPVSAFAALWLGLTVLKRILARRAELAQAVPVASVPAEPPAPTVPEVIAPEVAGTAYEAAKVAYAASVRGGNPLSERGLADRFGIPRPDAKKIRAEVVTTANGHHPEDSTTGAIS